jgi:hypothetical protein
MQPGIVEIITFLMSLSGFGLQANPKAPTADQALAYAMPDADLVVHTDVASIVPGNYKVLTDLKNAPAIKAQPELAKMVQKAVGEIEGARGLARTATGIDVTQDIYDATAFIHFVPQGDPTMVVTVHGKFTGAMVDKIAKMAGGAPTKIGGGSYLEPGGNAALGVTKDGVLLAGTPQLVRDRLADSWKAPAHTTGTLGRVADVLADKPVFAVCAALSKDARLAAIAVVHDHNFASDLINRHKFLAFAVYHDGIGWTLDDSTKGGLEAMATFSEGLIELMRAGQIAPRGFAKVVIGGLDSYRGSSKPVDDLINHKGDILKIVETFTGDGNFKVKLDKDVKALRLTVRATGKTLSEVVPLGGVLPLAAIGMLGARAEISPPTPVMVQPSTGNTTVPPNQVPHPWTDAHKRLK